MSIIEEMKARYNVDDNRVYLIGHFQRWLHVLPHGL